MKLPFERIAGVRLPAWLKRPSWRAIALLGGVCVVLAVAIAAAWLWFAAEQRRGLEAFAAAMVKLQLSQASNAAPEAKAEAVRDLERALSQRPPAAVSSQVSYELANLKYATQEYPGSRSAYELTARGASPTLSRLAQASVGYTWEIQKDYPKAIEAYEKAVAPLKPGEFLYDQLVMDLGRAQELAGRKDAAIKTYRRLADDPKSLRSDDARGRLADLGAQP